MGISRWEATSSPVELRSPHGLPECLQSGPQPLPSDRLGTFLALPSRTATPWMPASSLPGPSAPRTLARSPVPARLVLPRPRRPRDARNPLEALRHHGDSCRRFVNQDDIVPRAPSGYGCRPLGPSRREGVPAGGTGVGRRERLRGCRRRASRSSRRPRSGCERRPEQKPHRAKRPGRIWRRNGVPKQPALARVVARGGCGSMRIRSDAVSPTGLMSANPTCGAGGPEEPPTPDRGNARAAILP
jgi:hypothetical protein